MEKRQKKRRGGETREGRTWNTIIKKTVNCKEKEERPEGEASEQMRRKEEMSKKEKKNYRKKKKKKKRRSIIKKGIIEMKEKRDAEKEKRHR